MDFQIEALPAIDFAPLFQMTDAELAARKAVRHVVTACPDVPCRISLEDAPIGETVILVNHLHQAGDSPYRASHAIYVRDRAAQAQPAVNEVPDMIKRRLVSLRFFDRDHMIIHADVVDGERTAGELSAGFENPNVAYAHIHLAKPGCFAALVRRVD